MTPPRSIRKRAHVTIHVDLSQVSLVSGKVSFGRVFFVKHCCLKIIWPFGKVDGRNIIACCPAGHCSINQGLNLSHSDTDSVRRATQSEVCNTSCACLQVVSG